MLWREEARPLVGFQHFETPLGRRMKVAVLQQMEGIGCRRSKSMQREAKARDYCGGMRNFVRLCDLRSRFGNANIVNI